MKPASRQRSAALLLLLLATACPRSEPAAPDVVARIAGEEIRYAQVERYVARTAGEGESVLASDVLSQLFDQYLDEELLWRLAADRGLIQRGPEASAASRRRAIDALLADRSDEREPDEREVAAYYAAHRGEFTRPERVRLRQILTEDRAIAERAVRELAGGADFAGLARTLSSDPSAASGGYQGELSRADLPPAFADVIFSLRPGEVSRLIPADYGFHIFQVVARSPAGVIPLAEARPEIEERLRQERADRLLAELVEEARRRYNVEVHARNLPFEYRGSYERDAKNP
ncbi:MAG TPA: peptidylprolyl isomerase [Thermoanaerobaculia bacterium]|nr:peptidylprolyl isomerase [Thermoanaerobaculia bacterium]